MPALLTALKSTVGKKFVMGCTGLFLCFFLAVHLAGNLLLYVGPEAYNAYAHKLHSQPLLLVPAEIVLFSGFAVHLYLAWVTNAENRRARGNVDYTLKRTKITDRVLGVQPETMMFASGAVVFAFLLVHWWDFKLFELSWQGTGPSPEPFDRAMIVLGAWSRKVIYIAGALFVGLHVSHGLASAFQSLGLHRPVFTRRLKAAAAIFAILVGLGFASFPLWFSTDRPVPEAAAPAPAP